MHLSRARWLVLGYVVSTAGGIAAFGASWATLTSPLLFLVLLADGVLRAGSPVLQSSLCHGRRDRDRVALTFDDGPDPRVTPRILDALKDAGARATFFVIGRALEAEPELAGRLVSEGHEIGNHSWEHARAGPFRPSVRAQGAEIERGERAIATFTGRSDPPLYRPPFGVKSPPLLEAVEERNLTMVAWSLHALDTWLRDPRRIAARVLGRVRAGDIVLMHDGHDLPGRARRSCAEALPLILAGLREKGLECVTVSELIAAE